MNIRRIFVLLPLLLLTACKTTQEDFDYIIYDRVEGLESFSLSQDIPLPGEYITGKYENGLTYYIRQNLQPSNRVEIRLVLRAGSLLEKESQRGFAHFVEHMAFNGTEEFSQEEILALIESSGGSFGSHVNAFTSFDNTFYVLDLPAGDKNVLETGIRLIKNWAHKISFDTTEIDKERGVILEEWRARKNVQERLTNKHLEKTIAGSRWQERQPIGQPDIIKNGDASDLIDYYNQWYRPDLMSVMVIGDFDLLHMADLLDTHIAAIPSKPGNLNADELYAQYTIDDNQIPIVSIETDPELSTVQFALLSVQPRKPIITFEDLREHYLIGLHNTMLNSRLLEKIVEGSMPTLNASVNYSNYYLHKDAYTIVAGAKTGKTTEAMRAVLTEAFRAEKNGFTATELERAKQSWLAELEQGSQTMFSVISSNYASSLMSYIINGYPQLDADDALVFGKRVLPDITLEDVNNIGNKWLTSGDRIIQISAPENEKANLPDANQLIGMWDEIAAASLSAFVDTEVPDSLMPFPPQPGSVVSKIYDEQGEYHEWMLSNGARVILKETQFVNGQISFTSFSKGGTSGLDDAQYNRTRMTSQMMDSMGVANFDYITLNKFLSDKTVRLESSIDDYYEFMSGDFIVNDTNTFMQLLNLKFTQPRYDQANFDNFINYVRSQVVNQFNSPEAKFSEAIRAALYTNSERNMPFDSTMLDLQSLPDIYKLYQQRYANAADFTFIFVGDFSVENMQPFLEKYVASLPADASKESFTALPDKRTQGEVVVEIYENTEPRAEVFLEYRDAVTYSHTDELTFRALINALDIKLRQQLREEKSATYYVNVGGYVSQIPSGEFVLQISFSTEPSRVEELIEDVNLVLESIQTNLLEQSFVDNFVKAQRDNFSVDLTTNQYWVYYLLGKYNQQSPISEQEFEAYLATLNVEHIRKIAARYLATEHKIKAVMLPAK